MHYLPSRKILSMLILAIGVVGAVIFAFNDRVTNSTTIKIGDLTAGTKIKIPENSSWQNEIQENVENVETIELDSGDDAETLTDNFSVSLMSNYLALKQNGNLNEQTAQNLIDSGLQYFESTYQVPIDNPEFKIIEDNGKKSVGEYGDSLGSIFKTYTPAKPKNELHILTEIANTQNQEKLKEIDEILVVYNNIKVGLIKIPVPNTFSRSHHDMIKGLSGITTGLKEMRSILNDPVKSLISIQTYQENATMFQRAFSATKNFIYKQNVFYKQGSGGYYLLYGL